MLKFSDKIENEISYDIKADLDIINMKNWHEIEKLAPFGLANPKQIGRASCRERV